MDDNDLIPTVPASGRDKALSFHWKAPAKDWKNRLDLPPAKNARADATRDAILIDAILEAIVGGGRWISHSRRAAFYVTPRRYRHSTFSFRTVPSAIDQLADIGLFDHQKSPPGSLGRQSRFRASAGLIDQISLLPSMVRLPGELVRLKSGKRLADYDENVQTLGWRAALREINAGIAATDVTFDTRMLTASNGGCVVRFDNGQYVNFGNQSLHRVFNNDFVHGGRLYGGWWQNLSGPMRQEILIDGCRVAEPDHAQLHPRLLYRWLGKRLDGDAYDIDGWQRKLVKIAFNTMLNTSTAQQAQGAIANAIGGQGCYAKAATLMKAIGARHPDIVQFFNTGIGLRLQAVDANMAQAVVLELLGKGIVVLPVHDSFVVAEPYEGDVREAMERAFDSAP